MSTQINSNIANSNALVLGFTGGVGFEMAKALLAENYQVTALIRDPSKQSNFSHPNLTYQIGDARDEKLINQLTQNQSLVVYGINYNYIDWATQGIDTLEITAQACVKSGSRLLFPGNIYGFAGTNESDLLTEQSPTHPIFALGEIRTTMEERLEELHKLSGLKYLIFRAGNYIGEFAPSTWLSFLISQNSKNNKVTLTSIGDANKTISWCYLPDLAYNVVQLVDGDSHNLNDSEVFCFEGIRHSFNDLEKTLKQMTKQPVKNKSLPFLMVSFLSLFMRKLKMTSSTRSLFEKSLLLDQTKLINTLAKQNKKVRRTSIEEALIEAKLVQL